MHLHLEHRDLFMVLGHNGATSTIPPVPEEIATLTDLLTRGEFTVGFVAGLIGLLILFVLPRDIRLPDWGVIFALAALIGINITVSRRLSMVAGIALMAAGGWLLERRYGRRPSVDLAWRIIAWILIVGGAIALALRGGIQETVWLRLMTPAFAVIAGIMLSKWRGTPPRWLVGPLVLITFAGVWTTVPDTETARVTLGVAIPLAFATPKAFGSRLTMAGAFAVGGVLAWVGATGGEARSASIIGAWASLGVVAAMALAARGRQQVFPNRSSWIVGVHVIMVVIAARVIGLWHNAAIASIAAVVLWAAGAGVFLAIQRRESPVSAELSAKD